MAMGAPLPVAAGSALIATLTSGGRRFSPDLDQSRWWINTARYLPGPRDARDGSPDGIMGHRGITHWWGIPLVAAVVYWPFLYVLPTSIAWVPVALWAGWTSHLLGDIPFGRIPVLPWAGKMAPKIGPKRKSALAKKLLATGGPVEMYVARPAFVLGLVGLTYLAVRG